MADIRPPSRIPAEIADEIRPRSTYEQMMAQNLGIAMAESSLFFEGRGSVHDTLRRITKRLDELGIPYAVAGGLALVAHRYRRYTEDVDILVTPDGLKRIHQELDGRGYVRPFATSKNLRDAETKVKIEFLISGQFPGDGKPKPIAFPDPSQVAEQLDGIKVLDLRTLINLKLASGISGAGRGRDILDVEELIKTQSLTREFAESLDPYVRAKYLEIWDSIHAVPTRYFMVWRNKWLTANAKSISDMVTGLRGAAAKLEQMMADGVTLDTKGGISDDYAYLVTTDRRIAEKYDMENEVEFYNYEGNDAPDQESEGT